MLSVRAKNCEFGLEDETNGRVLMISQRQINHATQSHRYPRFCGVLLAGDSTHMHTNVSEHIFVRLIQKQNSLT